MPTKLIALVLVAWAGLALADTPPARVVNSATFDALSNGITSTVSGGKRGLDCNVSNSLSGPGNTQVIVSGAAIDPRAIRALTTSDQVSCGQLGTWNINNIAGTVSLPANAAQETGGNLAASATSLSAINGKMAAFDLDSGAGTQNVQGISVRLSASGGSVEGGTATNPLRTDPTGTTTQPISAASLPLPAGAATSAAQATSGASLASIDGKLNNTTAGALKVDGSSFTQPISASALPLPAGASTSANQSTGNTTLSSINSKLFMNGTSDASKVDGSSFTQPVSGSVTANQGGSWTVAATQSGTWTDSVTQSGTWNLNNITGTVSLPTGASTSALQTTINSSIASLSAKFGSLGQKGSSGSAPVVLASDQPALPVTQNGVFSVTQGPAAVPGSAWPVLMTDGTNIAAVKGASTAPLAADPSLVVAISPNSPITVTATPPTNMVTTGNLTAACATGASCGAGSTIQIGANGFSTFGYETHGTWSATLATDISFDTTCTSSPGTANWYPVASIDTSTNDTSFVNIWGVSRNQHPWVMNVASAECARLRVVSYTSGTVNVTVTASVGASAVWAVAIGNVASGSADVGNPMKVAGVYHVTQPTFTDGARGDLQLDASGNLRTRALASGTDSVSAVQSGTWNINNIVGTVSLPTGASTAANQSTANSSLSSIDTKTPTLVSGRVPVDGSGVTQPVSAASLPLPAGAATAAKQPALGTAGTASTDVLTVQGIASMVALKVDASATTQPVSGTVTANQGGAPWTVTGTGTAGTAASGVLTVQGIASMTALKVDGSAVTQPISATALPLPTGASTAANQATANASLSSIDTKFPPKGQTTSAASTPVVLASDQSPITITGSITASNASIGATAAAVPASATFVAGKDGSGNLRGLAVSTAGVLSVDGSAVTQPVSAASLPLPAGAATSALQTTGNTSLSSIDTKTPALVTGRVPVDGSGVTQPVSGTVAATQSGAWSAGRTWTLSSGTDSVSSVQSGTWTVQPGNTANTTPWLQTLSQGGNVAVVTAGNALKTDSSAITQPISASTLPLPTGASTSAKQPALGTAGTASADVITVQGIASMTALKVDGSAVTQPISAASLPLPAGAATSALQTTGNTSLGSIDTKTPSLVSGRVPVDGSGVTQPVSGIVTANQGGAPWTVTGSGTAGTAATGVLTVQGIASMTALKVDGSGVTQPVSGTVSAAQSGTWTTGRTWSLASGTDSVAATQSGTWTVQPGNTANTTPWLQTISQGGNSATVTASNALKVDGSAVTQPISAASLPLPTGAATSALQTTGNSSLAAISAQLPTTLGQQAAAASLAVVTQADAAPATQNVTVLDSASVTTAQANAQSAITGTPTAGSAASFALSSFQNIVVQVTGTWTGTLSSEVSMDGGTTWYTRGLKQVGAAYVATTFTANFAGDLNFAGMTNYRVRATSAMTGTATVKVTASINGASVVVSNPLTIRDATVQSVGDTIKAASTAALATDSALVVSLSPNSPTPMSSDRTGSGTITATDGTVVAQTGGSASLNFVVSGTWSATLNIEASNDGTIWFSISGDLDATDSIVSNFNVNGLVSIPSGGYPFVRLRANPYTSGTVNVTWAASIGVSLVEVFNTNAASLLAQVSGPTLTSIDNKTPALGQTTQASSTPSVQPMDLTSSVGSITIQDTGSASATQGNNQTVLSGTPTAGSTFAVATNSYNTVVAKVSGTWTGSVQLEQSSDGGTTWIPIPTHQVGGSIFFLAYTANVQIEANLAAKTNVRVRAPSAITGTASVQFVLSYNSNGLTFVNNAIRITDGANSSVATPLTVLAASTAAGTGNTSAVVALSPNSPVPAGTNTIGSVQLTDGTNTPTYTSGGQIRVVQDDGYKASYSAGAVAIAPAATATDVFVISGSASKTVRVTRISASCTSTAGLTVNAAIIKRSSADTGGTSAAVTAAPMDSADGAATASVLSYTANPGALGTAVGNVRTFKLFSPTATTFQTFQEMLFGNTTGQAVVLRGVAQQLAINLSATTITGGSCNFYTEWTEE